MTLQILISTMNSKFMQRAITPPAPYLVINQISPNKGLSKSRNQAIEQNSSDIALISDDDLEYKEDIEKIILEAFTNNSNADIITFQVQTPDGLAYKQYKPNSFWHTQKSIMSVSSVEIAFKKASIEKGSLRFDEKFGLGSDFPTGEEIIFLSDALKMGLKILYIPIPIVVHPQESSGKNYDNPKLIEAKGAMFYRLFSFLGYGASWLFTLKKYKSSPYSKMQFFALMHKGIRNYRSIK